jgi:hypothetical protein
MTKVMIDLEAHDPNLGYDIRIEREDGHVLWLLTGEIGFKCDDKTGRALIKFLRGEDKWQS